LHGGIGRDALDGVLKPAPVIAEFRGCEGVRRVGRLVYGWLGWCRFGVRLHGWSLVCVASSRRRRDVSISVLRVKTWCNVCATIFVMAANNGGSYAKQEGNPAQHFGKQMRKERLALGWSLREFSARSGVNYTTASLIENGRRPPNERVADACDRVFPGRKGWFREYHDELQEWAEISATFRNWADYEEKSATMRAWTPSIIDGLAQTEAYARAQIATETGIDAATREARLRARMERQRRVLGRDNPPRVILLVDAAALYRLVGSPEIMAAQMRRLRDMAGLPNVVLQVMPEVGHASVASEYLIADDAVWSENVITGGVYVTPETFTAAVARFDSLRGECMKVSESLTLLETVEDSWSGGKAPTRRVAGERA
jgi:transcriptional regulator with XRE-family HTH domain